MKWTTEKPTKEGWRFVEQTIDGITWRYIVRFYCDRGEILPDAGAGTTMQELLDFSDGATRFSDQPIPEPEE